MHTKYPFTNPAKKYNAEKPFDTNKIIYNDIITLSME